jgi:hypothetical protein
VIVPSGLGADHGSAALRRHLFHRCSVDTWLGFENRDAIFPIHRSVRFTIVCATNSGSTERLNFRCGIRQASELDRFAPVAAEDPAGATIPIARTRLGAGSEGASIPRSRRPSTWQSSPASPITFRSFRILVDGVRALAAS